MVEDKRCGTVINLFNIDNSRNVRECAGMCDYPLYMPRVVN